MTHYSAVPFKKQLSSISRDFYTIGGRRLFSHLGDVITAFVSKFIPEKISSLF